MMPRRPDHDPWAQSGLQLGVLLIVLLAARPIQGQSVKYHIAAGVAQGHLVGGDAGSWEGSFQAEGEAGVLLRFRQGPWLKVGVGIARYEFSLPEVTSPVNASGIDVEMVYVNVPLLVGLRLGGPFKGSHVGPYAGGVFGIQTRCRVASPDLELFSGVDEASWDCANPPAVAFEGTSFRVSRRLKPSAALGVRLELDATRSGLVFMDLRYSLDLGQLESSPYARRGRASVLIGLEF